MCTRASTSSCQVRAVCGASWHPDTRQLRPVFWGPEGPGFVTGLHCILLAGFATFLGLLNLGLTFRKMG